jgi:acyl-CoA thioester hydrolase
LSSFEWSVRVYWEDTDGGGIVYYANYLRFLERARTEWLRSVGFEQSRLVADRKLDFVVAGLSIEYKRPARLDDALAIRCRAQPVRATTLLFKQQIMRESELIASAQARVVCVDTQRMKPIRIPESLIRQLTSEERTQA